MFWPSGKFFVTSRPRTQPYGNTVKPDTMRLHECYPPKNAFDLKEWKRCHADWRTVDVMTWFTNGWQWITITARKGRGQLEVFHFRNNEPRSWWTSNERYHWKKTTTV